MGATSALQRLRLCASAALWPLKNIHCVTLSTFFAVLLSALPFITFLLIYGANETLRILPTYEDASKRGVRIFDVGAWETSVIHFSVNKLIASLHTAPLDFLSAVPYLGHYVLPVVYPAAVVFVGERPDCARRFYQLVGWTMWTIYVIWYLVPTAPPWFYDADVEVVAAVAVSPRTGPSTIIGALVSSSPSPFQQRNFLREGAAFARVDRALRFGLFQTLFAGNPVPFAAFPSGHVAWPTCMVLSLPGSWRRLPFVGYTALVVWATMYSNHHYVSDAVAALVVVFLVERFTNCLGRLFAIRTKSVDATTMNTNHWLP